jgi:putative cell wall-binding protein
VTGAGATRTLVLNGDLTTTTPLVVYNGSGVTFLDGRSLGAARVRAQRGFAFAPQGLVGASSGGTARLSWTDERNTPGDIARYEISRDGQRLGDVAGSARSFSDPAAGAAPHVYSVRAIDDRDRVSQPALLMLDPNAPNITPRGGFVLSDDGLLALTVPPDAVTKDHVGRFERMSTAATDGFDAVSSQYRLIVEAADDRTERLEAFDRYSCLSFRPGQSVLGAREPFRVAALRVAEAGIDELSTRAGRAAADACLLTPGDFVLGEAAAATTRVSGRDPALIPNRFGTAAGLSQLTFASAGAAVIARADDYPDALAASALAANVGGPVLLSTTEGMPPATVLELQRLGVSRVVLVGGGSALSDDVAQQAMRLGLTVERISGPTRFETAALISERVGSVEGHAFLATGQQFADALAASAPSSFLTRPILLTATDSLPPVTVEALRAVEVTRVTVLGGGSAVTAAVEEELRGLGFTVDRVAGPTRFETAVALGESLVGLGMAPVRSIAASGQGDGRTSPDALAAGPVAGRFAGPVLLVPRDALGSTVAESLGRANGIRGVVVAGGPAAVSGLTRSQIDAAAR